MQLADTACQAQHWLQAAKYLASAYEEESSPPEKGRLRWKRVECLYAAGQRESARRLLYKWTNTLRPETLEQWCLALRLCPVDINPQFVLNTVVAALREYPGSSELVLHLQRVCEKTGRWRAARPLVNEVLAAATSDQQYGLALRLKWSLAMATRDLPLAQEAVQELLSNVRRIPAKLDYLRVYAAVVLAWCGTLRAEDVKRLLSGVRNKELAARIHIAAAWGSLSAGDLNAAADSLESVEVLGTGIPPGNSWNKLAAKLNLCISDWRVAARLGVPSYACDHLREYLRNQGSRTGWLHAFALASLALAERRRSQGLSEPANNSLCASLGAWAAFLEDEAGLGHFILRRWRCYKAIGQAPGSATVRERLDGLLRSIMQQYADPHRLQLLWDLERRAVASVAAMGGLRLDGGRLNAGPLLAEALELNRAVRSIETAEIRLLYSPFGPAVALIYRHQFGAAQDELKKIVQLGRRREDFHQLLVECHLDAARDLVAQVPIDFNLLREGWLRAIESAAAIGIEAQVRMSIAEISEGRAAVLFEVRSREQRKSDPDRRPLSARRLEAIELENLAWELTNDPRLQAALAHHWYKKKDFDRAIESFFAALALEPNNALLAENLARVLRKRRRAKLEQELFDEAGSGLLEALDRLRELGRKSRSQAIRKAVEELEYLGPIPFVDASVKAMENEGWNVAVSLMIWALRLSPQDKGVQAQGYKLCRELTLEVEHGKDTLQSTLARLEQYLPGKVLEMR